MFRSSLIPTCSSRPLILVLSSLTRTDQLLAQLLFQYQTELAPPEVSSCVEARDRHFSNSFRPKPSLFVPQLGAISPSHIHEISGACIGIVAPSLYASSLFTRLIFYFRSIGNTYSHGIAKRVTPLRRCESIRSLNRRLRTALPV